MRIKLKNIINKISDKLSIPKSKIKMEAYFQPIDIDTGKDCSDSSCKYLIRREYKYGPLANCYGGLNVIIKIEGWEVFQFEIKDIKPYSKIDNKDIDELMSVTSRCSCIGPGFYSYCPYLILSDIYCKKEDIKTFQDIVSLDPNETKLQILLKNVDNRYKKEKELFLKKYNFDFLDKNFFKNFEKPELEF